MASAIKTAFTKPFLIEYMAMSFPLPCDLLSSISGIPIRTRVFALIFPCTFTVPCIFAANYNLFVVANWGIKSAHSKSCREMQITPLTVASSCPLTLIFKGVVQCLL